MNTFALFISKHHMKDIYCSENTFCNIMVLYLSIHVLIFSLPLEHSMLWANIILLFTSESESLRIIRQD